MLKKLLNKSSKSEQGFTIAETLISILITSSFLAVSGQTMLMAQILKIKSTHNSEAVAWIKEDLEIVKFCASADPAAPKCAANSLPPDYTHDNPYNTGVGKDMRLVRTCSSSGNILQITYEVGYDDQWDGSDFNPETIAGMYTEVINNAGWSCP